jgi:hypothetical protein
MRLRLGRLRLGGLRRALGATAAAARGHVFAAVHAPVAIAVGAAAAAHRVALMLVVLAALLLALRHLVASMTCMPGMIRTGRRLVLGMALMRLCGRRGLRRGGDGERKGNRGDEYLHFKLLSASRTEVGDRCSGSSRRREEQREHGQHPTRRLATIRRR